MKIKKYSKNKKILFEYEFFSKNFVNKNRKFILDKIIDNKIDTWDYQWNFCVRINNGLSIRPSVNLVENIGFGEEATHTTSIDNNIIENKKYNINIPLNHPDFVMIFKKADEAFSLSFKQNFLQILKRKIFEYKT